MAAIKKHLYDMVDVTTYTHETLMTTGIGRVGMLTMTEDHERFEFHEGMNARYARNPKLYRGKYLNVHRDKHGHYQVHFLRMELTRRMNPERVSKAIGRELRTAKKMLGL